jgi:hypothetical protein
MCQDEAQAKERNAQQARLVLEEKLASSQKALTDAEIGKYILLYMSRNI